MAQFLDGRPDAVGEYRRDAAQEARARQIEKMQK
jgi:predicted translin family RNA/ssDNA-binding protein